MALHIIFLQFFMICLRKLHDLSIFPDHITVMIPLMGQKAFTAVFVALFVILEIAAAGISQRI